MVELWDAYDKSFTKIKGVSLVRGKEIPKGMYHIVSEIIVKHSDGTYLMMLRDLKKHKGGMWELSAGGSALQGETPMECAIRELKEETGLVATNLIEVKRNINEIHQSLIVEYVFVTDCNKDSIVLQVGETIDYKWVDKETLLRIPQNEIASKRTLSIIKESNDKL